MAPRSNRVKVKRTRLVGNVHPARSVPRRSNTARRETPALVWAHAPNEIWTPKITYAEHLRIFTEALPLKESERKLILGENARKIWFKDSAYL